MATESFSAITGLSAADVLLRQQQYGQNSLPENRAESLVTKIIAQFQNPLIYILLFALVLDTGIWVYEGANTIPLESIAILLILIANAALGLWQNLKSESALAKLASYTLPHCWVIRDGQLQQIESRDLVPGDVVRVEAGERLAADGVVLQNAGFMVDESIVTGESEPVVTEVGSPLLSGTMAVRGSALMTVSSIGLQSNMGKLAVMLASVERDKTPLEKRLQQVGRKIAIAVSITATLLWVIGFSLTGVSHIGELFLFAVALAVAAVPESLPAVITLTLALGVERMAKRNAVVRKMSAVEALGSVTVIATDKTGTLTENKMTVQELDCVDKDAAWHAMALVNDADLESGAGDPLELGILHYVHAQDPAFISSVHQSHQIVSSRPFDAQWKYMRVSVCDKANQTVSYFKGAPEILLDMSSVDAAQQAHWRERIDFYASKGLRALALASSSGESEQGLTWIGLILLLDPPRAEVADSIKQALGAGIRVLMITGDHPATGLEIARQVGIRGDKVITGTELNQLTPDEFRQCIETVNVYARVSPELKYRIVKTLQELGQVVAVTGDGVNDAPALKAADVGVAMGQRGSDVSREVADLVLVDDNFATIIAAIEEGRNIFENIQKFMRFLFAANFAEVMLIVVGSLLAFLLFTSDSAIVLPLTAVQILWINLLTDSVPALALTLDRNPGVLQARPRSKSAALLDKNTLLFIFGVGTVASVFALAVLVFLPIYGVDWNTTQTVVFCYLTLVQLTIVYPARKSNMMPGPNLVVAIALVATLALQLLVVAIPALRALLGLAPLSLEWVVLLAVMLAISWVLQTGCSTLLRRQSAREAQSVAL